MNKVVDKTAEFFQILDNTKKSLDDSMVKTTGKIEMLQEIKEFFVNSGLKVVAEEAQAPNEAAEATKNSTIHFSSAQSCNAFLIRCVFLNGPVGIIII